MTPTEQAADRVKALVERLRGDGSSWAQPLFNEAATVLEHTEDQRSNWEFSCGRWREAFVKAVARAKSAEFVCALALALLTPPLEQDR